MTSRDLPGGAGGTDETDGTGGTDETAGTAETAERPGSRSPLYRWLDARFDLDDDFLGKPFPEDRYGSFLLGEVALFSFVVLVATGTFLGLSYAPVVAEITYDGQVVRYMGEDLPGAFASVLRLTYDVRLGMYTRMLHHWAAYVFIAAAALHMLRVFFSGAYRNPREPNWLVGTTLLLLALVAGFFGYALPFDNLSKTATEVGFTLSRSIPVVGDVLTRLIFGGDFPANAPYVLPRMYFYHVFVLPAVIAGLVALHLAILVRQTHTEQAGHREEVPDGPPPGDQRTVMGIPLWPNQAAISIVVFCFTVAVISFLAGLFPVQNVALIGPATVLETPPEVAPDWFFAWAYGSLKLVGDVVPAYGTFVGGVVVPTLLVLAAFAWPFVDRSDEQVHVSTNPLDRPLPTAVGVAAIAFVVMLSIGGLNAQVAETFDTTVAAVNPPLLVLTAVVPLVEGVIVYAALRRRVARKDGRDGSAGDASPGD